MTHPSSGAAEGAPAPPPGYGLPPLPSLPCPDFRGPTPWSNWVIKGRLLAGAYPAGLDDNETERILTTLLELGVNTFVCLQAEFSLHTPEGAWRAGQGLRPYIKDAQQLLIRARESNSHRIKQDKLDFLHLPIIDGSVTSDEALSRLADDCCTRILRGERLYIHCWGGHGRTGTLVAVMLGRLYGVACGAALRFTQACHDSRRYPQGVRSPQTPPQVQQVKRLLPDPPALRNVSYRWDPSLPLDDAILWPPASPPRSSSSPAARQAATASASNGAAGCRKSPAVVAAAAAVSASPGLHDASVAVAGEQGGGAGACLPADEGFDLPHVPSHEVPSFPCNQQRKDAIRAKHGGGSGSSSSIPLTADATAQAVSAAADSLKSASLQPKQGAAPAAHGAPSLDWLQSVFDKGQSKLASLGRQVAPAVSGGRAAQPAEDATCAGAPRANGYLAQYVQQQERPSGLQPARSGPSGTSKQASGSGRVVSLTASSGSAAGAAPLGDPRDEDLPQRLDLRPSKLTVTVPDAAGEQPGSSVARLLSLLSGRSAATRQ